MFPPEAHVSVLYKGGGGHAAPRDAYTDLPDDHQGEMGMAALPLSPTEDTEPDPLTSTQAKARMRIDTPLPRLPQAQIEPQAFNPLQSNQALHSSMASFPTSRQPVMDTTLKDMLMSLQTSLMTDLSSLFHQFNTDMHVMGQRVITIERGMTECTTTVNDMIDTYKEVRDEQEWVRAKLADLEDRSLKPYYRLICRNMPKTSYIPFCPMLCPKTLLLSGFTE